MKVRATQDGVYGGYRRLGPYEDSNGGVVPGEVFEVDATPYPVKDDRGNPVQEMAQTGKLDSNGNPEMRPVWELDEKGKPKMGSDGKLMPKVKMATFFSREWMEPVNDDATVTFPGQVKPFGVLDQMRAKDLTTPISVAARPSKLPDDVEAVLAANGPKAESPI